MKDSAILNEIPPPSDEAVQSSFDSIDTDNSGYVTKPEFKVLVEEMLRFMMS